MGDLEPVPVGNVYIMGLTSLFLLLWRDGRDHFPSCRCLMMTCKIMRVIS
jgi:hypothetical protein